jgi:hypothetical protein
LRSLVLLLSNAVVILLFLDLLWNAVRGTFTVLDIFIVVFSFVAVFVCLNVFLSAVFRKGKRKA